MADPITDKLNAMGKEFMIASDLPRIWATGAQAFVNPDFTMFIFREHNVFAGDNPGELQAALRNVASIVMPTPVAREFHKLLGESLQKEAPEAPEAASSDGN